MIRRVAKSLRRRSWVGLISSVTMHALFIACVWLVAVTFFGDDAWESGVAMVGLVAGERATVATPPSVTTPVRRAPAGLRLARPVAVRPVVPPLVAPPEPPLAPPPPAVAAPEPEAMPSAPAVDTAGLPTVPAGDERASSRTTESQSAIQADTELAPGPEDGRAVALDGTASRPGLARLQEVTADATVAARARAEPFIGRRDVFEFLLDNLEFATHVTRALRVARYRVWRTPEGLVLDDGWGALLNVSVVQATSGTRVIYARGKYRQTLLPDIHGEAVMMIEYDMAPTDGGRDMVSAAVTSYVKVDNGFMKFLMKLASAAATDKAETESRRLVRTFARVSRAIDEDPAKVFDEVQRRPDVPRAELEEFRKLLRIP